MSTWLKQNIYIKAIKKKGSIKEKMSEEPTPDPTPSIGSNTRLRRRRHGKRKPRKMSMKHERNPMHLKGATPELKTTTSSPSNVTQETSKIILGQPGNILAGT